MTVAVAFLQPGWADWEAGQVLPALREYYGVQIEIATPDGEPQTSIGGVLAAADYKFSDPVLADADVFLLIGSDAWTEYKDEALFSLLRQVLADGKVVGAICAGTVAAARAGLLAGRAHTSNDRDWLAKTAPGYAGADGYVDSPKAVTDGRLRQAGDRPGLGAGDLQRRDLPAGRAGGQARRVPGDVRPGIPGLKPGGPGRGQAHEHVPGRPASALLLANIGAGTLRAGPRAALRFPSETVVMDKVTPRRRCKPPAAC